MVNPSIRNKGEPLEIRVLRSVITPFCRRKARSFPSISNDPTYHLAFAVNGIAYARNVPRKRAEVGHDAVLPEEGVKGCVAGQAR
jgi:hypothetical protein